MSRAVDRPGARVALAVPNLNQGRYLDAALDSIKQAGSLVVSAVLDAGSSDESRAILGRRSDELAFWRSGPDGGQASAVNDGLARLSSEFPGVDAVGWLNADDFLLSDGLAQMEASLRAHPDWVAVTARGLLADEEGMLGDEIATEPFARDRFALMCTICQPASLIRRSAWEGVGGLDTSLDMCFDYDLWWRLSHLGPIGYLNMPAAASRDHGETKTRRRRAIYFEEAKRIVKRETGTVPWHWWISEALERRVDFEIGRRPGLVGRAAAAVEAGVRYLRDTRDGSGA
jgi:GT2 family glycosyltransferase